MNGPGKYEDLAQSIMTQTKARGVIVMIISGDRGHGFSVATDIPELNRKLPTLLRVTADGIEKENTAADN